MATVGRDDGSGILGTHPDNTAADERRALLWNSVLQLIYLYAKPQGGGSAGGSRPAPPDLFDTGAQRKRRRMTKCLLCARPGTSYPRCDECAYRQCCAHCHCDMQDELDAADEARRSVYVGPVKESKQYVCRQCDAKLSQGDANGCVAHDE